MPAQETVALAIEGWRRESRADGVVYYRWASQICAAGSVVSYKPPPHRPALTLAAEADASPVAPRRSLYENRSGHG
jgi:hypothetical protein